MFEPVECHLFGGPQDGRKMAVPLFVGEIHLTTNRGTCLIYRVATEVENDATDEYGRLVYEYQREEDREHLDNYTQLGMQYREEEQDGEG